MLDSPEQHVRMVRSHVPLYRFERQYLLSERTFLQYINQKYNPGRIFYPGSGSDQVPRQVFGNDRCVYTSLNDSPYYFKKDPPNIIADYRQNPFSTGSFDLIYMHGSPYASLIEAVSEFSRVLKRPGLIAIVSDSELDQFDVLVSELKEKNELTDITPPFFRDRKYKYFVHQLSEWIGQVITRSDFIKLREQKGKVSVRGHSLALLQG